MSRPKGSEVFNSLDLRKKIEESSVPFYQLPAERKSSVEIINEARASIRAVQTRRPFTPHERCRSLFGSTARQAWTSSSSNLQNNSKADVVNRPLTGIRLSPLTFQKTVCRNCPGSSSDSLTSLGINKDLQCIAEQKEAICTNKLTVHQPKSKLRYASSAVGAEHKKASDLHTDKLESQDIAWGIHKVEKRGRSLSALSETYLQHIKPIITRMMAAEDLTGSELIELAEKLYVALEENRLLERHFKERAVILRTVFSLLDQYDTRLMLLLSKIIITMNVSGRNLSTICKLVYKVSKNEANDHLFNECHFLEPFVRKLKTLTPRQHADALMHSVATVKFLSSNETVLEPLAKTNIIQILMNKIMLVNDEVLGSSVSFDLCIQVLLQLIGAVRNLLENDPCFSQLVSQGSVVQICRTLDIHAKDMAIVKNICRILSKVSVEEVGCKEILKYNGIVNVLLYVIKKYSDHQNITVRACFVLGSLAGYFEEARKLINDDQGDWLQTLFTTLDAYSQRLVVSEATMKEQEDNVDIIVKVMRIAANMSLQVDIGHRLAQDEHLITSILNLFGMEALENSEELAICVLSTLNNLSYYCIEDSAIYDKQELLTGYLIKIMEKQSYEKGIVEALRVLGNLSRVKDVRDLLITNNGAKLVISMLDCDYTAIIYSSCGILMNLMLDDDKAHILCTDAGFQKLVSILHDYGRLDWILCGIVCQTLWNFVCNFKQFICNVGVAQLEDLVLVLEELLDSESVICKETNHTEQTEELLLAQWRQNFMPVANDLLNRLVIELSDNEQDM